jgi:hypothetical protein
MTGKNKNILKILIFLLFARFFIILYQVCIDLLGTQTKKQKKALRYCYAHTLLGQPGVFSRQRAGVYTLRRR